MTITVYFEDGEPRGPYRLAVPAQRTRHVRFNDLRDPEPIPRATNYSSVIESDAPIVAAHTPGLAAGRERAFYHRRVRPERVNDD